MSAWHESAIADDPYDPQLTLTPTETDLLAIRLAIAHLTYEHPAGEWVDWEDVPWLDEASFEALGASVDAVVPNLLRGLLAQGERIHDIDSASLMEMAKHGPTATPTGEERDR